MATPIPVPSVLPIQPLIDIFTEIPKNKKLAESVKTSIKAIQDSISVQIKSLTNIPIKKTSAKGYNGMFYYAGGGKPVKIAISTKGKTPELTTAHEIGHYLALDGIRTKGKYSSTGGELPGWKSAVKNSYAYKQLEQLSTKRTLDINGVTLYVNRKHINYLFNTE